MPASASAAHWISALLAVSCLAGSGCVAPSPGSTGLDQDVHADAPVWKAGYWWDYTSLDSHRQARITVLAPTHMGEPAHALVTPGSSRSSDFFANQQDVLALDPNNLAAHYVSLKDELRCSFDTTEFWRTADTQHSCDTLTSSPLTERLVQFPLSPHASWLTQYFDDDRGLLLPRTPCGLVTVTHAVQGGHTIHVAYGDIRAIQIEVTSSSDKCGSQHLETVEYAPAVGAVVRVDPHDDHPMFADDPFFCDVTPWQGRSCGIVELSAASFDPGHVEDLARIAHRLIPAEDRAKLHLADPGHVPGGPRPEGNLTVELTPHGEGAFLNASWTGTERSGLSLHWDLVDEAGRPVVSSGEWWSYQKLPSPGAFFARVRATDWDGHAVATASNRVGVSLDENVTLFCQASVEGATPTCPAETLHLSHATTQLAANATAGPTTSVTAGNLVLRDGAGAALARAPAVTKNATTVEFGLTFLPNLTSPQSWSVGWEPKASIEGQAHLHITARTDANRVPWPKFPDGWTRDPSASG